MLQTSVRTELRHSFTKSRYLSLITLLFIGPVVLRGILMLAFCRKSENKKSIHVLEKALQKLVSFREFNRMQRLIALSLSLRKKIGNYVLALVN